jgi:hypothetical protein
VAQLLLLLAVSIEAGAGAISRSAGSCDRTSLIRSQKIPSR